MIVKNTRPTVIDTPSGPKFGPGEQKECDQEHLDAWSKSAAMRMYFDQRYLVVLDAPEDAKIPETTEDEKAKAARLEDVKASKIKNVADAKTLEQLMAMANNERDADVLAAINNHATKIQEDAKVTAAS